MDQQEQSWEVAHLGEMTKRFSLKTVLFALNPFHIDGKAFDAATVRLKRCSLIVITLTVVVLGLAMLPFDPLIVAYPFIMSPFACTGSDGSNETGGGCGIRA